MLIKYFNCVVAVCVLCFFLTVPWIGLQFVIVAFPGHTLLIFVSVKMTIFAAKHHLISVHMIIDFDF